MTKLKESTGTPLSDYEEEQLSEVMQMIENDEYHDGGWKNLNGGYAECELVDFDEEEVLFDTVWTTRHGWWWHRGLYRQHHS